MPVPSSRLVGLKKQIWSGSLPLEIRLAASDCRTYDESNPFLIQCPRSSYLAFIVPHLHAFFKTSLIKPDIPPHQAWLSFDGVPLKWHYPVGLLYDLYAQAEVPSFSPSSANAETNASAIPLPWRLEVHFTDPNDYPKKDLIQLDSEGKVSFDMYINSVKEADFIRNGSARTVMSLSKDDSDNLWKAVQTREI